MLRVAAAYGWFRMSSYVRANASAAEDNWSALGMSLMYAPAGIVAVAYVRQTVRQRRR